MASGVLNANLSSWVPSTSMALWSPGPEWSMGKQEELWARKWQGYQLHLLMLALPLLVRPEHYSSLIHFTGFARVPLLVMLFNGPLEFHLDSVEQFRGKNILIDNKPVF